MEYHPNGKKASVISNARKKSLFSFPISSPLPAKMRILNILCVFCTLFPIGFSTSLYHIRTRSQALPPFLTHSLVALLLRMRERKNEYQKNIFGNSSPGHLAFRLSSCCKGVGANSRFHDRPRNGHSPPLARRRRIPAFHPTTHCLRRKTIYSALDRSGRRWSSALEGHRNRSPALGSFYFARLSF